jgi:hypothetical protein
MIRRASISVRLNATLEAAWSLLSSFEQAHTWVPDVTSSRVLTVEGDISVIELIHPRRAFVLEVVASPPTGVRFQEVDERGRKGVSGSFQLRKDPENGVVLDAEIRAPAPLLALGFGARLRSDLERAATTVENRLLRPPTAQLQTYRRALSVVRRGDVIEARIGDDVIELLRLGDGE